MNKLLMTIINFLKNSIDSIIDIILYMHNYYRPLIMLGGFILGIYISTIFKSDNHYYKNYILYSNLSIKNECKIEIVNECYVNTAAGNFTVSAHKYKLLHKKKFDIGMLFGNCKNELYFKIYKDDILNPYEILTYEEYDYDEPEFKRYNNTYKLTPKKCE